MGMFSNRPGKKSGAPQVAPDASIMPAGPTEAAVITVNAPADASTTAAPAEASSMQIAPKAPTAPATAPSGDSKAATELKKYWPVLVTSCVAYVLLQAGNAFVPAITMKRSSADLGMSVASFGALNSVGAGIKSVLIIFCMGPLLERFGPHRMINYCLVGTMVCNVVLSFCPGALSFSAVYLVNYVFNSLSEQPAYICLYATYFDELLGVTTTAIASAFSFAGFLIPPLLSPIMVAFGWRALWLVLAGAIALLLPLAFVFIRPGPNRLNTPTKQHANFIVDAMVLVFASRLHARAFKSKGRKRLGGGDKGFAGGKLGTIAATDPELILNQVRILPISPHISLLPPALTFSLGPTSILHQLGKASAISGHDEASHDHHADVTLSAALTMPKFWALVVAAFTFFLYGKTPQCSHFPWPHLGHMWPALLTARTSLGATWQIRWSPQPPPAIDFGGRGRPRTDVGGISLLHLQRLRRVRQGGAAFLPYSTPPLGHVVCPPQAASLDDTWQVLTGVFLQTPALKRSVRLHLLLPSACPPRSPLPSPLSTCPFFDQMARPSHPLPLMTTWPALLIHFP